MPTALILGGGIGGLSAGIALSRAGWDVSVRERATTIVPMGAALSLWANATAALDRLGMLAPVRDRAAPITDLLLADRWGRAILRHTVRGEALLVTRADLQSTLAAALPSGVLRLGHEAISVHDLGDRTEVRFRDGSSERADLVVDAGGIRSAILDTATPDYRGYGGVVALSEPIEDTAATGRAAEYWGIGERFGLFELPHGRRYWFYMRDQPADAWAPDRDQLAALAADWPGGIARAITATPPERVIPFAIHARAAPRSLGAGNVIRVGDAAHAMEPNLGQGACQAIEDAVALEGVARANSPAVMLPEFERLRLKRVAMVVGRSAQARHGAHGSPWAQQAIRGLLRLAPTRLHDRTIAAVQSPPTYCR